MSRRPLNRTTAHAPQVHPVRAIQFGAGRFLRGFFDWMVDRLNQEVDFQAAVAVVRPTDQGPYQELLDQEGLFHVVLRGLQDGRPVDEITLVRCVADAVQPYQAYRAFLALATLPGVRLVVSNTTETGIRFQPEPFPVDRPAETFPGKLTALLYRRFQHVEGAADGGWILLPCELIQDNGHRLQEAVLQYAAHWDLPSGFHTWVERACLFCNTLVDRIVTGWPQEGADALLDRVGFQDRLLTVAEPYHLWAIQAPEWVAQAFPAPAAGLNVHFVQDITPFRERKVRLLNGAHTAMTPLGLLAGLETVGQVVDDPELGPFIRALMEEEIVPSMDRPRTELEAYVAQVWDRFRNPFLRHRLADIVLYSVSKWRVRLLPTLLGYTERYGQLPPRTVLALAGLLRLYRGEWKGHPLPIRDEAEPVARIQAAWAAGGTPEAIAARLLQDTGLWGQDLTALPGLVSTVARALEELERQGVRAVLRPLLSDQGG